MVAVRSAVIAESALDSTVEYTKQRQVFGKTVFDMQNTQFKLAEIAADVEAARPLIDRCIELHAKGELDPVTAAKAKLWTTDLADRVLDECLQLHGGYGYIWGISRFARAWADARVHRIYAGTNEIMKYIIGASALTGTGCGSRQISRICSRQPVAGWPTGLFSSTTDPD